MSAGEPEPESELPPASAILARFFAGHPGGGEGQFESWAEDQPELTGDPDLRAAALEDLKAWLRAAQLLAEGDSDGVSASIFRRSNTRQRPVRPGGGRLEPGRSIGPFVLREFLASGGMGQVWEAEDTQLRRRVALKLVLPDRVDEKSLALFLREARAGGRVHHPGLVATLSYGTDDGLSWIAQELVAGSHTLKHSLDDLRSDEALPKGYYDEVAELVAKIADGMQAAHDGGVIHRDLKPQNILVDANDQPKVTDFGLARLTEDSFYSKTGDFAGTWAYMSPEQVTAKRMGLDHRTDIFSLGVVLYELLALRRPFNGDTTQQIAQEIIFSDPPLPSQVRSQCPQDLSFIAYKAMEKEARKRYPSMAAMAEDLRRFLRNEPIAARPPSPWNRISKWARRNPRASSGMVVLSVALAIISLLLVRMGRIAEDATTAKNERTEALSQLQSALEDAKQGEKEAREQTYLALLLSAQQAMKECRWEDALEHLENCPEELRGWEWRYMQASCDTADWYLPGVAQVSFSEDGERLYTKTYNGQVEQWDANTLTLLPGPPPDSAFEAKDNQRWYEYGRGPEEEGLQRGSRTTVEVMDLETGEFLFDLRGHADRIYRVGTSVGGELISTASRDSSVRIWDSSNGEFLRSLDPMLASPLEHGVVASAFSSDSLRLASGDVAGTVRVWNLETGQVSLEMECAEEIQDLSFSADGRHLVIAVGGRVRILPFENLNSETELVGLGGGVATAGLSQQGDLAYASGMSDHVLVWDVQSGDVLLRLEGHRGESAIQSRIHPDGTTIATTAGNLRVWSVPEGDLLWEQEGNYWGPWYSADGEYVYAGSRSGVTRFLAGTGEADRIHEASGLLGYSVNGPRVLGFRDARESTVYPPHGGPGAPQPWKWFEGVPSIKARQYGPHLGVIADGKGVVFDGTGEPSYEWDDAGYGQTIYVPSEDLLLHTMGGNEVRVVDLGQAAVIGVLRGHTGPIERMEPAGEPDLVATIAEDAIRVWRVPECKLEFVLALPGFEPVTVWFNADSSLAVTSGRDRRTLLWDVGAQSVISLLAGAGGVVGFSPDERYVSMCSFSTGLRLWNLADIRKRNEVSDRLGFFRAFSPNGERVVTHGSSSAELQLWDTAAGVPVGDPHPVVRHASAVFSPNSAYLVVPERQRARVVDVQDGRVLAKLEGERALFDAVAVHDDLVATSSYEQAGVRFWTLPEGRHAFVLGGDDPRANRRGRLVFDDEGSFLAATAASGIVIWDLEERKEYARLSSERERPPDPIAFGPDCRVLLTNEGLWALDQGDWVWRFPFVPRNMTMTSESASGKVSLVQQDRGQLPTEVLLSPARDLLLPEYLGAGPSRSSVMDFQSGEAKFDLETPRWGGAGAVWSGDQSRLVIPAQEGCRVLNGSTGQELASLPMGGGKAPALCLPRGRGACDHLGRSTARDPA